MNRKDEYLPNHDEFYGHLSKNSIEYFKIIGSKLGAQKLIYLSPSNKDINEEFNHLRYEEHNFEAGNSKRGVWDVVYKFSGKGEDEQKIRCSYCIEYKTSLEESNINELLRQIKQRKPPKEIIVRGNVSWEPINILLTFDYRFEKYRQVIENEFIGLIILDNSKKQRIKKKFSTSDKKSSQIGDFSND